MPFAPNSDNLWKISGESIVRTLDSLLALFVALQYALDHTEKIQGVTLIASSGMRYTADNEVPSTFGLADISWLQPILGYVMPCFKIASALRDSVDDPENFVTDEQVIRY